MSLLDNLPIWAVYIVTVVVVLMAAEVGFRLGLWRQQRDNSMKGAPMTSSVVGGMLGLMAFLMAFSIGIVINQQNERRAMVVTEANAIGTAFLRSSFLAEPDLTASRNLLREYAEVRLAAANDPALLESAIIRSEEIHGELWDIVEDSVSQGREPHIMALFVESINDVIDVHSKRLAAVNLRLPDFLVVVLYVSTVLSFLMIGVANSVDGKRDFAAILLFTLAFVAVLMIVVDTNRPKEGLLKVSQQAMVDLLRQLSTPVP